MKTSHLNILLINISIVINIILLVYTYNLPENIKNAINSSQNDIFSRKETRNDSIRIVTANIPIKGSLIFFEGKIIENGEKLRDSYKWTADDPIPEEIWDGYIHLAKSKSGGKYYIWADRKIPKNDIMIKGWFIGISPIKFGIGKLVNNNNEDYIQLIAPIVQKKELKDGI